MIGRRGERSGDSWSPIQPSATASRRFAEPEIPVADVLEQVSTGIG